MNKYMNLIGIKARKASGNKIITKTKNKVLKDIKEKDLNKLYYSIWEVAAIFEVNTSLIRFWEKEFTIIQPKKNKKGNRMFTAKDIINFNKIHHLVKVQGFTLDGAKKAIKNFEFNPETKNNQDQNIKSDIEKINDVICKLENIKDKLQLLKK